MKSKGCCGCVVIFLVLIALFIGGSIVLYRIFVPQPVKKQITSTIILAQDEVARELMLSKDSIEEKIKNIEQKGYNVSRQNNVIIVEKDNYKLTANMNPINYYEEKENSSMSIQSTFTSMKLFKDNQIYELNNDELVEYFKNN